MLFLLSGNYRIILYCQFVLKIIIYEMINFLKTYKYFKSHLKVKLDILIKSDFNGPNGDQLYLNKNYFRVFSILGFSYVIKRKKYRCAK
jgi:hypothetical protein